MIVCQFCQENFPREFRPVVGKWVHPTFVRSPLHCSADVECAFQSDDPSRKGDWIQTFTGRQFYALDPRPDDIHILDIAAGLRNARYSSQSIGVETVAEHCVLMWQVAKTRGCDARARRAVLMHDASEAFLVDVPRPIKRDLANYVEIEDVIMRAIAARFDFDWPPPAIVKELDSAIIGDERDQIMAPPPRPWRQPGDPLGVKVECLAPDIAMLIERII